jgi:transposase
MSRGGIGTKVHLVCDGKGLPIVVEVTAGQAHESTRCIALVDQISIATGGRPRQRPDRLAGDKGYSMPAIRAWLKHRMIEDVIPTRKDQTPDPDFDKKAYRDRNTIERLIGWLKECRRLATRYEKLAIHYLGMLTLGMIRRYLS